MKDKARYIFTIATSVVVITLILLSIGYNKSLASTNQIDISSLPESVLFEVGNMKPGDTAVRTLTIQNSGVKDFAYSTEAIFIGGSEKLYNAFHLQVEDSKGLLYDGKLSDFTGLNTRSLLSEQWEDLQFSVVFPPELGNDYQGLQFEMEFKFAAKEVLDNSEGGGGTNPSTPVSGDALPSTATSMFNILLVGLSITLLGLSLLFYRSRKRKGTE
ncbi:LPXTG cell wall anchor domain-containing protein [Aquibacillus kalidii]|uniref:LPXTG cell wall anchor domain-containing protein n=1 Tax=Aquibacillus kalidii TaxID=2762597 RepID=UPI001646F7E3|nr:LPXTG cell wall anchor domain-containing protein [Aquibacillus kalidii]